MIAGGVQVIEDDWRELCDTTRDVAEGFAATDPNHAWKYREEAEGFARLAAPLTSDELLIREAEARDLKQRWTERFRHRNPR